MMRVLPFLYILVEAVAFWAVAQWIGWGWAFLALFLVFFLGLMFSSFEFRSVSARAAQGGDPGRTLGDTGLLIVGSILIVMPGFVTAAIGLFMVLPPSRALIRGVIGRSMKKWLESTADQSMLFVQQYGMRRPEQREDVIDMPTDSEMEENVDFTVPEPEDFLDDDEKRKGNE